MITVGSNLFPADTAKGKLYPILRVEFGPVQNFNFCKH